MLSNDEISRLIETAKKYAENAYCPYSSIAIGSALLCAENVVFAGCNIENGDFSAPSFSAGDTVLVKAISEGYSDMKALCLYSKRHLPYPNAMTRQHFSEFNPKIKIIVATADNWEQLDLSTIYPVPPSNNLTESAE